MKFFVIGLALLYHGTLMASHSHIVGALVNSWTQAPVMETTKPFDLAIQGRGFFVLELFGQEKAYARYGAMELSADGYLIHSPSQGKVLGFCDGEMGPIRLADYAFDASGSVINSVSTGLDGEIKVTYKNGTTARKCRIALALFSNPLKLKRKHHTLYANALTGVPDLGLPSTDSRGVIFASSLELMDEHIYQLNSSDHNKDQVVIEVEKERAAREAWLVEKMKFYVLELGLTKDEIASMEHVYKWYEKVINNWVATSSSEDSKSKETSYRHDQILMRYEAEAAEILGDERLKRLKVWRDQFNQEVWDRFGINLKFTGL